MIEWNERDDFVQAKEKEKINGVLMHGVKRFKRI